MKLQKTETAGIKNGVTYYRDDMGTLFCEGVGQPDNPVGGDNEQERNDTQNIHRMTRIRNISISRPKILDWGCGHGMLVKFLRDHRLEADGYDKYNPEFPMPEGKYNFITAIEVVEHFSEPYDEFRQMFDILDPGGTLMIESSFSDFAPLEDVYVDPALGHVTVWSHGGLERALESVGFHPGAHINRNARIYLKA
jgi:hypothetical protein